MPDVLIAGAGPAGSIAALVLARAGAQVRLLDRASFPRDKLCGDTLNPGTLSLLEGLGLADHIRLKALPVDGMLVTGAGGVSVRGRYRDGLHGLALVRRDLDSILLDAAIAAGAEFESSVQVRGAIVEGNGTPTVAGLLIARRGGWSANERARVTIAADGRHSTLAFSLRLAKHPAQPKRWAIGAYYDGVRGLSSCGEMHVRAGHYLGVAPVPGGSANVCLVTDFDRRRRSLGDPIALITGVIASDRDLRDRFAEARLVSSPVVLGPLAVEAQSAGMAGLLLAGDAAGFIDPMTGDGLRFAVQGGQLAAAAALEGLASGRPDAHVALAKARARAFNGKYRFNRTLRRLVSSPSGVKLAGRAASVAPVLLRALIEYAGDSRLNRVIS